MYNLTQCLRQARQFAPDKAATVFHDRVRTWREIHDRVAKLARALVELGADKGERFAVLGLNTDRYLEIYFAGWWSGAVVVPMNTRWNVKENVYALNDSEPVLLMVDDHFVDQVPQILDEVDCLKHVVHFGEQPTPEGMLSYEGLLAQAAPLDDRQCTGDDLAGIFYTGGTTGFPKGVMLSHENMYISSLGGIARAEMDPKYVFLHHAPMFHMADAAMVTMVTMGQGTHAIIEGFEPKATLEAIERHRVTHALFIPAMLGLTLNSPEFERHDLSSLTRISYGASPMPVALLLDVSQRLPGIELWQGYGQTELAPLATILMPDDHVMEGPGSERLRSAGRALPHCEVEVVDEDLQPLPSGEVGQIRVRGGNGMVGYWNLPELTAETIVDGWVLTGDAGYLDDEGFLFLVDRVKDMIISGGENVYSVEVENVLMNHGSLAQCAVIGIPHDIWVEQVHAVVVPKPGMDVTEQELIDYCHEYIAGYKCPRSVEFRHEPLPLSGAGKVLKRQLRAEYSEE